MHRIDLYRGRVVGRHGICSMLSPGALLQWRDRKLRYSLNFNSMVTSGSMKALSNLPSASCITSPTCSWDQGRSFSATEENKYVSISRCRYCFNVTKEINMSMTVNFQETSSRFFEKKDGTGKSILLAVSDHLHS
jgi:hypothetical protein